MNSLLSRLKTVPTTLPFEPLTLAQGAGWVLAATACLQLAYTFPACSFLMLGFMFAVQRLARVGTTRQAMNVGWVLGLLVYGPQLRFFWNIFGAGAITLWLVLAFWLGLFLVTLRQCWIAFGRRGAAICAPMLWLGFEFFRSELYYLRFTWVNAGYAFFASPLIVSICGVYGIGFLLMALASTADLLRPRRALIAIGGLSFLVALVANMPASKTAFAPIRTTEVQVAGLQLEFPSDNQVLVELDRLKKDYSAAELLVLSENTFDGPVPERVRAWCRKHKKFLIAGGKHPLADGKFYNTAFVITTNGEVVFEQAKSVPVQFFKDGLPAAEQRVWESPWGRIGVCICYDLSYTRVTDELIRQGAQALVVPTMDVEHWGEHQHELHSRVAPVRAAEFGVPIFRLASSGISQLVRADATVLATAPFAKEDAIGGTLSLVPRGRVPLDRVLAWTCVAITALLCITFLLAKAARVRRRAR